MCEATEKGHHNGTGVTGSVFPAGTAITDPVFRCYCLSPLLNLDGKVLNLARVEAAQPGTWEMLIS